MKITWTKNLRVRVGAAAAALLATAGLYGVIQAQPLHHASSAGPAQTPTPAATVPPQRLPVGGGFGSAGTSPIQPPSAPAYQPPAQSGSSAPSFRQPHARTRAS